jgi:2-desacetyl-2-hydroxyethyl bacteriochlorophyllide A dehydrogenase
MEVTVLKAAVLPAPERVEIEERPKPQAGPEEIVVRVASCGVCGTDQHIYKGELAQVHFPLVPGHELAGEIVEVGGKVDWLREGDRVALDPNITCGHCFWCQRGEVHLCANLQAIGVTRDGGFAEFCVAPAVQAVKLPEGLSLEQGALAEPLACCVHGADILGVRPGERIAILGGGFIGMLLMQLAKAAGAGTIIVSEPAAQRRETAQRLGADIVVEPKDLEAAVREATDGIGVDAVIESAGRKETARQCLDLPRRGGRVLFFGVVHPEALIEVSPYAVYQRELTIMGSYVNPFTHARAVQLLAEGKIKTEPLVSHRFPVEEFAAALHSAVQPDAVKVVVEP